MKLLDLPSDYLIFLFTEWLKIQELGLFDMAMTNYVDMIKFRKEISSKQFVHPACMQHSIYKATSSSIYYKWLILREIAVKEITLLCDLDCSDLSKLFKLQEKHLEIITIMVVSSRLESMLPSLLSSLCTLKQFRISRHNDLLSVFKVLLNPTLLTVVKFCAVEISLANLSQISLLCNCIKELTLDCTVKSVGIEMEPQFSNLTKLILVSLDTMNDEILFWFMKSCQRLETLNLLSKDVTSIGIAAFLKFTSTLRNLAIFNKETICDDYIPLISQCKQLEKISFIANGNHLNLLQTIADKGLNLKTFCVWQNDIPIEVDLLKQLIPTFTNMACCMLINVDLDDSFLCSVVDNCPNLTIFVASRANFSNEAMVYMSRFAKNLRKIDIRGSHINDNTMYEMSMHSNLTHIGIWCECLTSLGYACLGLGFPSLIEVFFAYENKSSDQRAMVPVKKSRPKVTFTDVDKDQQFFDDDCD